MQTNCKRNENKGKTNEKTHALKKNALFFKIIQKIFA